MTLSRLYARLVLCCLALGCLLMFAGFFAENELLIYFGGLFMILSLVLRLILLSCPHCGYRSAPPQWSKSGTVHCPKCGKAFEYDK